MTAMAGSSRTLYQGSVDGWLPRYLSDVNHHGAPTASMWTDLVFNLVLLFIASDEATAYYFVLAVTNCGYIIFNFLNLNAGWIHRIDSGHIARPYKAPTVILALGGIFAFVNAMFMGAGAKVWNARALCVGHRRRAHHPGVRVSATMCRTTASSRHGCSRISAEGRRSRQKKAGVLPYLALAGGVAVVLLFELVFKLGVIFGRQRSRSHTGGTTRSRPFLSAATLMGSV